MDKLELLKKALPMYLNHGLKGIINTDLLGEYEDMFPFETDTVCKLISVFTERGIIPMGDGESSDILFTYKKFYGSVPFSEFKPLLRPLSDLTKEIEHNGETIIPLQELSKIMLLKVECHIFMGDYIDLGHGYSFHFNKKEVNFECRKGFRGEKWDEQCYVPNQLKMFDKLHEWHFDTRGLIDNNLAIDINTIK